MKEREGKELHGVSHEMLLRLQKSEKAVSNHTRGRGTLSLDLSVFLLTDEKKKATSDVCLELGNSQQRHRLEKRPKGEFQTGFQLC